MPYRFVLQRHDYTDFAAGQVLLRIPGQPCFPVRLVSELFQRCLALRRETSLPGPCTVYDPCCGSGYLLTTLAYLHGDVIGRVIGSDVDADALGLARKNLALTTVEGLEVRIEDLQRLFHQYGKASHAAAIASARRLLSVATATWGDRRLPFRLFCADSTDRADMTAHLAHELVDVVLTDVPYGRLCSWRESTEPLGPRESPVWRLLDALLPHLSSSAIIAIAMDKQTKAEHPDYHRLERFQVGKRRMVLLRRKG